MCTDSAGARGGLARYDWTGREGVYAYRSRVQLVGIFIVGMYQELL